MKLPVLISVPHAGLAVPPEVERRSALSPREIMEDGDGGAAEVYDLEPEVQGFVSTAIARAFVDVNRAADDRSADGVVKTKTCWNKRVYTKFPSPEIIDTLLEKYYRPYHARLQELSAGVKLGLDCHTMATVGPPVGPDPGEERPLLCLSNAESACPEEWIAIFARALEEKFDEKVAVNHPFTGGFITRSRPGGIPWMQVEFSRSDKISNEVKRRGFLSALKIFCMAVEQKTDRR